ncbi:MAG: hypothetical protein E7265_00035 [Lachnospiraceae bacterium]|nr:hypothetical protein [Lachnospiraceae bacterium]
MFINKKYKESLKQSKKYSVTQTMLIFRVLIAGYIIYTDYELIDGYRKGNGLPLTTLIIVSIVFLGLSLYFGIDAIIALYQGKYIGGKADIPADSSEDIINEETALETDDRTIVESSDESFDENDAGSE